ncbi:RNA polymerase sigma factor [Marinifilum fragile]|uniref:RNA polymerase sigma factor n=1 Tax=Marinifilum fragile TaxID=570161 RepID=UPI000AC908C3|nr:RNA polymerase sigma factor [Marinifilum fragile]
MNLRQNNPTDYDLVKQYIDGNQECIDKLINRHKDRVYTYIYLIVKNHQLTEDIFQDTFIKVIRSLRLGKYQDNGKFLAWVLRIAHNLIIDHFRREKQSNTFSKDDYELDIFNSNKFCEGNCEDDLIRDQIHDDIRELVKELPADQREVVILRHYKFKL